MGIDVKLTTDPTIAVRLDAAVTRGLQAGGEMILQASDLLAPIEPDPKHGVHMVETGFVRPEGTQVAVGYEAFWAVWQEVKDEYHHEHGQAHFLETALVAGSEAAFAKIAETIAAEIA